MAAVEISERAKMLSSLAQYIEASLPCLRYVCNMPRPSRSWGGPAL